MLDEVIASLPPLRGCLYCHSEGSTVLRPSRRFLGRGSKYLVLRCSACGAVAWLDANPATPDDWRICYRRVGRSSVYYYAAIHLGRAGWLSAHEALAISTRSYVQRRRVEQVEDGDLSWLQPVEQYPPLPLMGADEQIYLVLKAVTLQQMPVVSILSRVSQVAVLDSGKLFVTDQKLHLLGQRKDWSHALGCIQRTGYDDYSWMIHLNSEGQPQQYRGVQVPEQMDAQLVAVVIGELRRRSEDISRGT